MNPETPETEAPTTAATATAPATGKQRRRRIFLVEDHPIVRAGLSQLIDEEPDLCISGSADGVDAALAAITKDPPDAVVIDLHLQQGDGLDLLRSLRTSMPALPLLVLSMHNESLHAERALRAGARGYIMKQEATVQVMTAIRRILAGGIYVSDAMSSKLLSKLVAPDMASRTANDDASGEAAIARLSEREHEIFRLIGQGLGPTAIAERLGISIKTIESHRENIKAKLKADGREMLRIAMRYVEQLYTQ